MRNKLLILIVFILPVIANSSCHKVENPPSANTSDLFDACIPYPGTDATLDIVTFNVETMPLDLKTGKDNYTRVIMIASLLNSINADVYGLQEVATESGFNQLLDLMPGYTGKFYPIYNSDWNLAYIFRKKDITVDETATKLLFPNSEYFLRPPFEVKIHHKETNLDVYIIDNHFKASGGDANETNRRTASAMLKDYLDTSHPTDAVVMLGDYNDEIASTSYSTNPYLNFVNDPDNYEFADMGIAKGSQLWWSYPSYPSHIDHILITNELFSNLDTTIVYKASPCYPDYGTVISDHRPVGIRLSASK